MQTALLKWVGMFLLVLGISTQSYAQIPFTENFTTFQGTGFAPTPAAGQLDSDVWKITGMSDGTGTFGGTHTTGDFARGTNISSGTGGVYGAEVATGNFTLGVQPGGSDFTPGSMIVKIQNTTGAVLTSVTVAYDIYYDNNAGRANSFNFSYNTADNNGTYTPVAALDFTSAVASDALGWQSVARTTTITGLTIPINGFLYLSWTGDDNGGSGSRDRFALDNVSVTTAAPPAVVAPIINEYVTNHAGNPDTNDFIEVFGTASTNYSTLTLLQIEGDANGNQGNILFAQAVGTTDAGGYWTTGYMNETLQGGNSVLLLVEGFTGAVGDDLDSNNDGVINGILPWTTIKDEIAISSATTGNIFGFLTLNNNYDGVAFNVEGASRIPNGTDTNTTADWKRNDFDGFGFPAVVGTPLITEAVNTLGEVNRMYVAPTGVILVTGTLNPFTTTAVNIASTQQSYQVRGTTLTADITITAPTMFGVSLTSGGPFTPSVSIPFATANAGNTTVYVHYLPTAGTSHTGNITHVSTGATSVNLAVSGSIPPSVMTIAVARTRPINEIVTIEGVLTAANQFGGPAFIQDATGGIAVFDAQIHGGAFPIGQSLRITAKRADFNNQIQLSNVSAFTDLGAGTPVVPQVITIDQLAAHRGELVKVVNVTFPNPNTFLFGNSNYNVTNGANSGIVRIDGDTDLAGRTQPTTCDVTGVIGYFQTAPQLIPRFQADLPCTTPYVSPTSSTITSCIAAAKTLEVSTWNIEWFGFAQANTPSANTSPAAQKAAAKAIIKDKNSDIYFLGEINNVALMGEIAAELTLETTDTWDTLFSYTTSYAATSPLIEQQKVGFLFKSNIINPQFSYSIHKSIHPYYNGGVAGPALAAYPEADKTRFWASGRLPFMMRADVTLNGSSEEINFIALHARSGANPDQYDMRRFDVTLLQDSIAAWLGNDKVIMGGDYNDDVDESIYEIGGVPQLTSYDAFTSRPADYTIVTKALSDAGIRSTVGFSDMIDHTTVSNELANGYIPNSVSAGYEYYDGNYERTTSDHFIISSRFEIVPIASCFFTATANSTSQITLNWTDSTNIETSYVVEVSLDGTTGWTAIAGSPFVANSITNVVTGLNASTQYFFRVRAEESATNFSEWVYTDATTLAPTPTPPTVTLLSPVDNATNVAITTNLVLTFDRNVQAGTGNITVTDGTTPIVFPIAGNADATVTIATNTVTINLTANLANAMSYNVLIDAGAIEEAGTGADFAGFATATDWNFTTAAASTGGGGGTTPVVTTPTNFKAIAISTSQINLTWDAVNGAAGYILYRGNTLVATLGTVNSFQDTGLMSDTFYSYRLVATNGGRVSDPIQANARTFPDAPSLLSVTNACSGSGGIIKLSSTGTLYRVYADSTSTTPLFETNNATMTSPSITQTTTFYVSVVSNGRESNRTAISVNVNQLPTANILENNIFSCASTGIITAEEVSGASYTWIINGSSLATATTASYEVTRSGNYQVRVTLNGCSAISDITSVRLNYLPVAEIAQGVIARSCESSTIISARNADQNDSTVIYQWTRNNVVVGNTASVSVSESGIYMLTVTQFGCSASDEIKVEISTINPNVSFTASQTTFCPEEEVTLTVENPEQNVIYTWVRNGRVLTSTGTEYKTSIAGEYRVQASQNSCSVLSEPIKITRTRVEPVYLREEEEVLFVESITPITNVVWLFEGEENTALAGQLSFTPTETGYYSARVTFETGCKAATRTVYYKVPEPVVTGEEDIISIETIVYPNPSKTGIFRVQLSTSITSDVTFTITDNIGRVLESKVIKATEISTLQTLDLSKYAKGMYALTIDTEQGKVIKKIIIE